MKTMLLQIDDAKAGALQEKAQRVGLEAEQLLAITVDDLIGRPDADFEEAVQRVLTKNRELYRRLA
ncbi:MAG: DNA-binding protein [Spartobacteria bacterium]|nr:DNA-binding protein [Spartobacteria bacterium]